jgi:hypothetical protein
MITISPTSANVKFGAKQTFTASEGGTWKVQSSNGSVIDNATGVLVVGSWRGYVAFPLPSRQSADTLRLGTKILNRKPFCNDPPVAR